MKQVEVLTGDSASILTALEPDSIHAVVTDPDYEFPLLNSEWVGTGTAYQPEFWRAVLRVVKPGGHLVAFGGARSWHRLATAIEDGGFEIRDSIAWLYATGFSKSLDISKEIDRVLGAERTEYAGAPVRRRNSKSVNMHFPAQSEQKSGLPRYIDYRPSLPATPEAAQWEGWGTALKPAHEPILIARKPLEGTNAANTLRHGVGGLNLGACAFERGGLDSGDRKPRLATNVILDESQAKALDGQTVALGGASRFFYNTKVSAKDRPTVDGVFHPTNKPLPLMRYLVRLVTPPGGTVLDPFAGSGSTAEACVLEGFNCTVIEREPRYIPLINLRVAQAHDARTEENRHA